MYNHAVFRLLWIVVWLGLLISSLRSIAACYQLAGGLQAGILKPQELSVWQLGIIPFTLMAVIMLFANLRHFSVHTPSRTHWKLLVGMLIMIFWMLLFSFRMPAP